MSQSSNSDSDSSLDNKTAPEDYNSDSSSGWGSVFSENDKAVSGLAIPGKPILKKTGVNNSVNISVNNSVNPFLPKDYRIDSRRDAKYAHDHAISGAPLETNLLRRDQNRPYNTQARRKVVKEDAENRDEIIKMFKKFEENNPHANTVVTIDESKNALGTAKRKYMGDNVVTVKEDRRQKSRVVADKVSDILFKLLKDTPPGDIYTRIDELIATASPVNTSLKHSDELTVRQLNHLNNANLFDRVLNETIEKITIYKKSNTAAS